MATFSVKFHILTLLFSLDYISSKYLLLKIKDNSRASLEESHSLKEFFNFGVFRNGRSYPEIANLKPEKRDQCSNHDLKTTDSFTVDLVEPKDVPPGEHLFPHLSDWVFLAMLKNKVMSSLGAKKNGICNDVETKKPFRGCGLATILMEYCFTDDKVGGVDIPNDPVFKKPKFSKWRQLATKKCEHMVYLLCLPEEDDFECSGYLTAAINTKHTIMFVADEAKSKMEVLDVSETQPEFKKDAAGWIEKHGRKWFFCHCKADKNGKCSIL